MRIENINTIISIIAGLIVIVSAISAFIIHNFKIRKILVFNEKVLANDEKMKKMIRKINKKSTGYYHMYLGKRIKNKSKNDLGSDLINNYNNTNNVNQSYYITRGIYLLLSKEAISMYPFIKGLFENVHIVIKNYIQIYNQQFKKSDNIAVSVDCYTSFSSGEEIYVVIDLNDIETESLFNKLKINSFKLLTVPGFAGLKDLDDKIILNKFLPMAFFKAAHDDSFDPQKNTTKIFSVHDWELGLH